MNEPLYKPEFRDNGITGSRDFEIISIPYVPECWNQFHSGPTAGPEIPELTGLHSLEGI